MPNRNPSPVPTLPEIVDPERLPASPLIRYYIADCPIPPDEFEEPYPYVEAESAVEAAMMARTLYGPNWGRFALLAWRDPETNEMRRFAPGLNGTVVLLQELADMGKLQEASQRLLEIKQAGKEKRQP